MSLQPATLNLVTDGPLYGLAGQIARQKSFAGGSLATELAVVVIAGSFLGRRVALEVGSRSIFPNLMAELVGDGAFECVSEALSAFRRMRQAPTQVWSGIASAEGVVYLVRDPYSRPEKLFTRPNEPVQFQLAVVDQGSETTELLILQPEFRALLRGDSTRARLLRSLVGSAFNNRELQASLDIRAGGLLTSHRGHIAVLTSASPQPFRHRDGDDGLWLSVPVHVTDRDLEPDSDLMHKMPEQVLLQVRRAVEQATPRLALSTDAQEVMRGLANLPIYRQDQILKVATVYAVLEGEAFFVHIPQLRAAADLVERCHALASSQSSLLVSEALISRIECLLRAHRSGLDRTSISRRLHGKVASKDIAAALDMLRSRSKANVRRMKTRGREREIWSAVSTLPTLLAKVSGATQ